MKAWIFGTKQTNTPQEAEKDQPKKTEEFKSGTGFNLPGISQTPDNSKTEQDEQPPSTNTLPGLFAGLGIGGESTKEIEQPNQKEEENKLPGLFAGLGLGGDKPKEEAKTSDPLDIFSSLSMLTPATGGTEGGEGAAKQFKNPYGDDNDSEPEATKGPDPFGLF